MAEQNQPTLEQRIEGLGSLNYLTKNIAKEKDIPLRSKLYESLAYAMGGRDEEAVKSWYTNFKSSPEDAYRHANELTTNVASELEPLYKENKDRIAQGVIANIKDTLGKAENKAEAASLLSAYFKGLFETPELDQVTADNYAQSGLEQKTGVKWNSTARGSIEKYKSSHASLHARLYASQYLEDIKDEKGNVTGYRLNEDKIKELMEDIKNGATIYLNTQVVEKAKAQEGAKKKQTKRAA